MIDRSVTSAVVLSVCALGVLGIVVCVVIWLRKKHKTTGERFLLLLSFSDLASLLTIAGREISWLLQTLCGQGLFLIMNMVPRIFSDLLCIAIAIQRCIAVHRPLLAVLLCTIHRQQVVVFFLFMLALVQAGTIGLIYYLPIITTHCGTGVAAYLPSWELSTKIAVIVNMVISLLTLIILIASNVFLLISLKNAQQFQDLAGRRMHEKAAVNVTRLVICVCSLSALAILLANAHDMYFTLNPNGDMPGVVMFAMEVLLALNQASHFLFYTCFLDSFRSGLKRCCCATPTKRSADLLSSRDIGVITPESNLSMFAGAPKTRSRDLECSADNCTGTSRTHSVVG